MRLCILDHVLEQTRMINKMAASIKKKVHVEYHSSDSGSEGDLETSSDVSSDGEGSEGSDDTGGNVGLANVMAKILQKKVADNKVILAKAKTDRELQKRKLEKAEGELDDEATKPEGKKIKQEKEDEEEMPRHEKKKLWENMCRSKPDPLERERERRLQRVATRGVVQLFNAVRTQQKLVDDEIQKVGRSERRKDLVMAGMTRDKFLNILKGSSTTNVKVEPKQPVKEAEVKQEPEDDQNEKWGILRDDYMMGAPSMKDWDRASSDSDGPAEAPGVPDLSDSD